jgi:lysophospholipase L1-like esterase
MRLARGVRSGLCLSLLSGTLFLLGSQVLLPEPQLSRNDLHLLWLVSAQDRFVELESQGRPALYLHPDLAFGLGNGEESFPKEKPPGVFRVFCVGGSTTRGWPFLGLASYPRLLALLLRDVLPGRKVEVINAGVMGSDSTSDLPLVRELLRYSPDLILLYEGRNEAVSAGLHRGVQGLALRAHGVLLRRCRLYAWLKTRWVSDFREPFDHAEAVRAWTGAAERPEVLKRILRRNLRAMAAAAARRDTPVVLLTQVAAPEELESGAPIVAVNAWLRELAAEAGWPLIDLEAAFQTPAEGGARRVIPVSVHPDLAGYALLARSVGRGLAERGLLGVPAAGWRWERGRGDADYIRALDLKAAELGEVYARLSRLLTELKAPDAAARYRALAQGLGRRSPSAQSLRDDDL